MRYDNSSQFWWHHHWCNDIISVLGLSSYQVVLPFPDIYKIDSSYPGQTVRNIENVDGCHNSHFECRNIRLSWYISNSTG